MLVLAFESFGGSFVDFVGGFVWVVEGRRASRARSGGTRGGLRASVWWSRGLGGVSIEFRVGV